MWLSVTMLPFSKVLCQSRQTFAFFALANSLAWAATFLAQASFSKDSKEGSAEPEAGVSFFKGSLSSSCLNFSLAFVLGFVLACSLACSLGWLRLWKLGFHLGLEFL